MTPFPFLELAEARERVFELGVELGRAKERRFPAEVERLGRLFEGALREFHALFDRLPTAFVKPRPYAEACAVLKAALGVLVVVERYGLPRQRRQAKLAHARAHAEFAVALVLGSDGGDAGPVPTSVATPEVAQSVPAAEAAEPLETKARRLEEIKRASALLKGIARARGGETL